jgi:hypothetical protein
MRGITLGLCFAALGAVGCMPVGNYHTARTLGDGESSIGLTFSATTYSATDEDTGEIDSLTIPSIIPEISYHIGMTDDFEIGGRIAPGSLYGEIDLKDRFVHSDRFHLAAAPAIGQMAFIGTLTILRLPLVMTYELSDRVAVNAGVNATSWNANVDADDALDFYGAEEFMVTSGVSLGIEFTGKTAFFRPTFEWGTMITDPEGNAERFKIGAVFLHFGFVSGRELKKLEEMDQKLDRIEQNMGADNWKVRRATTDG